MITDKDLLTALGCLGNYQKPCRRCVFNPKPEVEWPYGCVRGERDMAEHISALIRSNGKTEDMEGKP